RQDLATYVSRVKGKLRIYSEITVASESGGYRLAVDDDLVDLHHSRRLARAAQARAGEADHPGAFRLYREAEAEWRGEPLADVKSEWADGVRARLAEDYLEVLLGRVSTEQRLGRYAETVPELTELVHRRPPVEPAASLLLIALAGAGRQGEA